MKELLEELEAVKTFAEQSQSAFENSELCNNNELSEYIEKIVDLADICLDIAKDN